jgi:hypothetical protein
MTVHREVWVGVAIAVLSSTASCGNGGSGASVDASTDGSSAADAKVGTTRDAGDGSVVSPAISDLVVTPNPNSVLSATLTFTTNVPTTASVLVTNTSDGGAANSFTIGPTTTPATSYSLHVLGMRAQSHFVISVNARDAASRLATGATTFTTGALPAVIPPITVVTNDPTKTSPGFTLMPIWRWDGSIASMDPARSPIVAVDAEGQVVWYYVPGAYVLATKKLPNGDIVFIAGDQGWTEIDMMGGVVRSYTAAQMGLDSLHHDITLEASSDFLGLTSELRTISGYPTPDGGTAAYAVVGDVVLEFDADGGILNRWHEFDMLDPMRKGNVSQFNGPLWNTVYPDAGSTKDWTHTNTVFPDDRDGTIIVSSRTQSWIIKFNRNDGGKPTIVWRLGEGGDFALTNANETFQYGQHAVNLLANGNLMMFDDGNARPAADGGVNPFSRALEYSIDTTKMTATIVWQYEETPAFFSPFLGSSYLLPNGNVLICAGGLFDDLSKATANPTNIKYARIMEVTHDPVPTKVLEYTIRQELGSDPSDPTFSGYSVFRAIRIPSLY